MVNFVLNLSNKIENYKITWSWWFEQIAPVYLVNNIKAFCHRIKKYGFTHFVQCIRWIISPFTIRCFMGFIYRK